MRAYSHFLLFWVIFAFIITTSIILGTGLGGLVIYIYKVNVGITGVAAPIAFYPSVSTSAKMIIGVLICCLILYFFANVEYSHKVGYRLKTNVKIFVAKTAIFLAVLTIITLFALGLLDRI